MVKASCCGHEHTTERDEPFMGPVSREENCAAHYGVCHVETCADCGSVRRVNQNHGHREVGRWFSPVSVDENGEA